MRRRAIPLFLCAALLTLAPISGNARVSFTVGIAPPAPVVETVPPPPPGPGYVWQPGYYTWNGSQYVWVPGAYVLAPYPAAVWVPHVWVKHGGRWEWHDGHWRR
jgi:WXXGXW repeat (2 copies)